MLNVRTAIPTTTGNEISGDYICELLNRRAAALPRPRPYGTICASKGISAYTVRSNHQRTVGVSPLPRLRDRPGFFSTGIGSPEIIDSSMLLGALNAQLHPPALSRRPNAKAKAYLHLLQREISLRPVLAIMRASFGRQPEQSLNCSTGLGCALSAPELVPAAPES